jgi:hypothetical protein
MAAKARPPPTYRVFRDQHGIPQFEPKRGTPALKDALIYAFPALETELQLMQAALRKFFDSERCTQFVCELPENDLQASLAKKREVPVSPVQATKTSLRNWKITGSQRTPSRPSSRASSRASSRGRSRASSRAPSRAENPRAENPASSLEPLVEVRAGGIMTTWNLSNGQEMEKRKRQPYDPIKRRKVAENRGNACDKHRASKTTVSCRPRLCAYMPISDHPQCDPDECPQNKINLKAAVDSPKESSTLRGRTSQVSLSRARPTTKTSTSDTDSQNSRYRVISFSIRKMFADISHRTRTDDVSVDSVQTEHTPPLAGAEVFWDAFKQSPQDSSEVQGHNSILNFGDSGYWTENDGAGPIPWSSCNNYPAFPESLEGNFFSPGLAPSARDNVETFAGQNPHSLIFNATDASLSNSCMANSQNLILPPHQDPPTLSDETPHQTYTALVLENSVGTSLTPFVGQSEETLMCSEDPFMGWASKKANHLFDDYGWVLSHVENL